jgi:hypothetical protein
VAVEIDFVFAQYAHHSLHSCGIRKLCAAVRVPESLLLLD